MKMLTDFAAVGKELHKMGYAGDMAIELAREELRANQAPARELEDEP